MRINFTRSELRLDEGGVMGDRIRFSLLGIGGSGGGGGGATFLGIFFRLLIKTVELVLFDDGGGFGDGSCLTWTFSGDLLLVDVGSVFTGIFCDGLFTGG
jgi:hypothetical protein